MRVKDERDGRPGAGGRLESTLKAAFGTGENDCGHGYLAVGVVARAFAQAVQGLGIGRVGI